MVRSGSITSRRESRVLVLQSLCEADIVSHEVKDVLARLEITIIIDLRKMDAL